MEGGPFGKRRLKVLVLTVPTKIGRKKPRGGFDGDMSNY